jgi:hypothetical protein
MKTIEQTLKENGIDFNASTSDTKTLRAVNRLMRDRDDSALWPICSRFNATDRAIRWYSRRYFAANGPCSALEYALGLESKISEYVNSI